MFGELKNNLYLCIKDDKESVLSGHPDIPSNG